MSHDAEAGEITRLLHLAAAGDADADERVFALAYDELRRLARSLLRGNGAATIEPTAIVNEAFLRLGNRHSIAWQDRHHFYGIAARAMRRVLIDHARARLATKRAAVMVTLTDAPASQTGSETIVAIDEAMVSLAALNPRQAKVVELRWFAGLDVEDTAAALGVSAMTVKRDWAAARAFLAHALTQRQ